MSERRTYRKRASQVVHAIRLDLDIDTGGFTYRKWGGRQRCDAGDWLVNNAGDVYTVDAATFERTYRQVRGGEYQKAAAVWAEQAWEPGSVPTKEGSTAYRAGDYIVSNDPGGTDAYVVGQAKFEEMYERAD
jgi:hypothetical protein